MAFIPLLMFGIIYFLGVFGVQKYRKQKDDPDIFFFETCWTIFALLIYLAIIEIRTGSFFILLPVALGSLFLYSYRKNKHRLINGLYFNIFAVSFGGYLIINLLRTEDLLVGGLLAVLLAIFLVVLFFGLVTLVVFLYWNSLVVFRRESHSVANLLTLILAIVLTIFLFSDVLLHPFPQWVRILFGIAPVSLFYLFIVFLNFLSVSVLYQFNHPRYNQDFILVLGAGLINGDTVSPLLAQRIRKAIDFYHLQFKAKKQAPRLLMSGGQGHDEKVPEAIAMKEYAIAQGIPEGEVLVETNSTTTLENMQFSKEVMDELKPQGYNAIFSSNNYHIFRAGLYADQAGIKANGIGAKTAFYYLPNAFLREFVAILFMHKKRHILVLSGIILFYIIAALLQLYFS